MYELKVITHFSAAHQLKGFEGACEALHGHNWKVEVYVTAEKLKRGGIAVDFRVLKKYIRTVLSTLDHQFLNNLEPFVNQSPSSENIAKHIAQELAPLLEKEGVRLSRVTAWESDTACATYYPFATSTEPGP